MVKKKIGHPKKNITLGLTPSDVRTHGEQENGTSKEEYYIRFNVVFLK